MIDTNNPKSFHLSNEENQKVFKEEVIPNIVQLYDFTSSNSPTVSLTGGLPGAGKSALVNEMLKENPKRDTFIANSDELRPFHPQFKEAVELFGVKAGMAVHNDATIFSEKLIDYAQDKKVNFIIDSTLKDPEKTEKLIDSLQNNNYNVKVTMIAVNEFESIHGIFNRYAEQYKDNPKTARFVNPKFIAIGKENIPKSAEVIEKKNIQEFKIIDRDHKLLYNSQENPKISAKATIQEKTDLKNWDKSKIDKLVENWNRVVAKLENIKAPQTIQESAKNIKKDLINQLKSLQKNKPKFNEQKRKQVLENLQKGKEKNKGVER